MKKINYSLLFLLLMIGAKSFAQCPETAVLLFDSQEDIDSFIIEYPSCTDFMGSIHIGGTTITSLSGLENLSSISGSIHLYGTNVTSLGGLENLVSLGGKFDLRQNDSLMNLNGLENLTSIGGSLDFFLNENLTSLSGLENLITIGGYLSIWNNDELVSLAGLNNLTTIDDYFLIDNNNSLTSLSALNNLTYVGDILEILYNPSLTDLTGLDQLTFIGSNLRINNNSGLQTLNGLENLSTVSGIGIYYNDALLNINSLANLNDNNGFLGLIGNSNLSLCTNPFTCDYLFNNLGSTWIYDNAYGCDDDDQILSNCEGIGKLSVHTYYDLNENATQDIGEPYLPMAGITIEPTGYIFYDAAVDGEVEHLYLGDYHVSLNENELPDWSLTTAASSYDITLDSINKSDTLYFGLAPNTYFSELLVNCVNGLPRCNEFVIFEPMVMNSGTTTANGVLWFRLDENTSNINFIDTPDTIVGTDYYGWFFSDLYPQHIVKKEIGVQLPGVPDISIGDILTFEVGVEYTDQLSSSSYNYGHRVEIQCAFDPNDKLVVPQYPENYALIDEDLIYTIRFQNTGNAEAYDVVITDELDPNLDLATFQYITSSHESVLSTYLEGNMLTFEFRDIFLPDSTSNFDESQGYVMYSIRALDTIDENTNINNTANIFFDFNPAVVTNTTENKMLSTFDFDEDGFELWNDCDDNNPLVNNGATEIPYNSLDDDCDPTTLDDDFDQDGFVLADDCDDENPGINPDAVEILNNGIDEDCDGEDLMVSAKEVLTIKPQVFPNPTSDLLQIVFPIAVEGTYELRDLSGKLLLKNDIQQKMIVDLERQAQCVYILLIKTKKGVWTERIVKF